MNVTNDKFKDRQLHIEDYLQMVPAEQREYAKVSACQRIAENNHIITDFQTDGLLEQILQTENLNRDYRKVKSNKGAVNENGVIYLKNTYDEEGRVTSQWQPDSRAVMSAGDIDALTSASMTYTPDNRLDTYNGQKVTYDLDGNMTYGPLNGVMTSFEYDCRNRLVKAGDTTYEYDAEDTRIAVQTKDRREEYIVDKNAAYSQVLSITGYEKNLLGQYTKETDYTVYTYGIGLISQESGRKGEEGTEDTAGKTYYLYHYNQVGSTTQVTDETGNIAYRYAYSPYGERMGTYDGSGNRISDDTPIRFLYNGQAGVETDKNGLYYMRARYYNTDIKRFLNRDILDGTIDNGQSLNKYSYVQGNPVTLTNRFGLCPVGGSMNEYLIMLGHTALDL